MEAFCNSAEEEISFDSFIQFPVFLFRLFFFEFKQIQKTASRKEKLVNFVKVVYFKFCVLTLCAAIASLLAFLAQNLDDFGNASSCIPNALSILVIAIRVSLTFSRKPALREVFRDLSELFASRLKGNRHQKLKVKDYLSGYNRLMKIYVCPVVTTLIPMVFAVLPYLFNGTMKLFVNYWYPFDPYRIETFPFAWMWVTWIAWHILVFLLASDSLLYALITVIVVEFEFLKTDFGNLRFIVKHERKEEFKRYIERHNKLLKICDKLQDIYSIIFFTSFAITSMVLCFVVFQISIDQPNVEVYWFYVSFLGIAGVQVWLLCLYGQKLIDASESMTDEIYSCGWETLSEIEFKKQFVLIMARTQKAQRLTALGFADISLETFAAVG